MKLLVLGDIHGRTQWKEIVARHENEVDMIIFLGDYVTTHESITNKQQVDNFMDIRHYKEENPDKVVLLYGNHDCQMMGLHWAECSGWSRNLYDLLCKVNFNEWMRNNAKVAVQVCGILFTHAGVTKTWLENNKLDIEKLLNMGADIRLAFAYDGFRTDGTGDNVWQSPIWVRPMSLLVDHITGVTQVVGHTPVKKLVNLTAAAKENGQNFGDDPIYLCDCGLNQYLLIDTQTNEFKIENYGQTEGADQ